LFKTFPSFFSLMVLPSYDAFRLVFPSFFFSFEEGGAIRLRENPRLPFLFFFSSSPSPPSSSNAAKTTLPPFLLSGPFKAPMDRGSRFQAPGSFLFPPFSFFFPFRGIKKRRERNKSEPFFLSLFFRTSLEVSDPLFREMEVDPFSPSAVQSISCMQGRNDVKAVVPFMRGNTSSLLLFFFFPLSFDAGEMPKKGRIGIGVHPVTVRFFSSPPLPLFPFPLRERSAREGRESPLHAIGPLLLFSFSFFPWSSLREKEGELPVVTHAFSPSLPFFFFPFPPFSSLFSRWRSRTTRESGREKVRMSFLFISRLPRRRGSCDFFLFFSPPPFFSTIDRTRMGKSRRFSFLFPFSWREMSFRSSLC